MMMLLNTSTTLFFIILSSILSSYHVNSEIYSGVENNKAMEPSRTLHGSLEKILRFSSFQSDDDDCEEDDDSNSNSDGPGEERNDCEALQVVYTDLNVPIEYGWTNEEDCCLWYAVTCNLDGHVQVIDFPGLDMGGTISSRIGDLLDLEVLKIWDNELSNTIPETIGNLKKLSKLELRNNFLSGALPSSMGEMSSLKELYLHDNFFTSTIPQALGNMESLEVLNLGYNEFMSGTLPENFGAGLTSLREIELHNSCFGDPVTFTGTIPSSFFVGMENLQVFDVYCASLEGTIPDSVADLDKLVEFDVRYNSGLIGSPTFLCDIPSFKYYGTNFDEYFCFDDDIFD